MKLSKLFTIIVYLVVVAIVFGVVGMFVVYLNNGQKSFYLQNGSNKIYTDNEQYHFVLDDYNVFYVKNSLGLTNQQEQDIDYTVQVVLNPSALANYGYVSYKDGDNLLSIVELELTDCFELIQDGNRFLLRLDSETTLLSCLKHFHNSVSINECPEVDLYSDNFLTLVITNKADESSIRLGILREVQE